MLPPSSAARSTANTSVLQASDLSDLTHSQALSMVQAQSVEIDALKREKDALKAQVQQLEDAL